MFNLTTRIAPGRSLVRSVLSLLLATALPASAASISVVGMPHLSALEPAVRPEQQQVLTEQLGKYRPSLVCVEAMPGERVENFARDPQRYSELLRTFALDAARLALEQQLRLQIDAAQAREQALAATASEPADVAARLRLVALHLAAHDPWSAALNWSYLDADARGKASETLGALAPQRLDQLLASSNEMAAIAIPLARQLGHRRLCAVDAFVDELGVQALESGLLPLLQRPGVMDAVQAWQAESQAAWQPGTDDALLQLVRWYNRDEFARKDQSVQWTIFDADSEGDAGRRRLMLWHARNAEIATHLFRALAQADGQRVLLLIGAAHRPYVEAALRSQPWVTTVASAELLAQ